MSKPAITDAELDEMVDEMMAELIGTELSRCAVREKARAAIDAAFWKGYGEGTCNGDPG